MIRVAIITVSERAFQGIYQDQSGPALTALLPAEFSVVEQEIVPDEIERLQAAILRSCEQADLILTTGGTGLGPRDRTPEATAAALDFLVPGIPERIRAAGPARSALSRGVAGVRGKTLVINLPGSPKGAVESLSAVLAIIPHAVAVIKGGGHE